MEIVADIQRIKRYHITFHSMEMRLGTNDNSIILTTFLFSNRILRPIPAGT